MKVLILTQDKYAKFIGEIIFPHNEVHDIHVYSSEPPYPFEWVETYDIGVSFMYQHKVPAKELTHTWFNFHPAPLPQYKGRNLCYHAIMNGEKLFGASVHYMDENFDTGGIIDVWDFPIEDSWTAQDLHDRTMLESKSMFQHFFPMIIQGYNFGCTANEGGTYYKKQEIEDTIPLNDVPLERWIRAVTYGDFHPKIYIGGVRYKIVRDE